MLTDELAAMESAEELFAWLGQDYDPAVLRIHRVRILKRFGRALAAQGEPPADHEQRRQVCAQLLRQVYDEAARADGSDDGPVLTRAPRLFPLRRRSRAA